MGIKLAEREGYLTVVGLVPGGPADKSHDIQEGDRLVEIDKKPVVVGEGIFEQVRSWFSGERGSPITIGLARTPDPQTESESITLTLKRDNPPNDLPLKENLENFENFKNLKTRYEDWTLDINNDQRVPMITSETYGIDKFVKNVFFIQGTAFILNDYSRIVACDVPFWKPFSKSVLDKIKQNNEVDEKFTQLRDAIRKFSDEHNDLDRLRDAIRKLSDEHNDLDRLRSKRRDDYTVHVARHGSGCSSGSSNKAGFNPFPFGLIGRI